MEKEKETRQRGLGNALLQLLAVFSCKLQLIKVQYLLTVLTLLEELR